MYLFGELHAGLVRESNSGPLAPEARIMPLDQQAADRRQALPSPHESVNIRLSQN